MPTKKFEEEAPRKPSVHSIREKKQNKLIIIGFIVTAALIIGMVGYALLYDNVFKNYIPVAKVDNKKIDNDFFVNRVRLERNAYIQQYSMLLTQYQMFAGVEEYADYVDYYLSQLSQIQSVLDDYESFGELVLNSMIDDQIIAIEADRMGIDASDEEIDELVMQLFDYYPNGTPTPQATSTPYTIPPASDEQQALLGYTATPETAAEAAEVVEEEVLDESEAEDTTASAAEDAAEEVESEETVEATATATEAAATATALPTSTPYTEELYQENFTSYISDLESIGISEKYLREYIYHYLLSQKVQENIYADVPVEQEQVWARHILVETEEEAQDVISRLDNGEDWNTLAAELSLDTSNSASGGDLGWFPRGYMVELFEEAAFALQAGDISQPVETDYGWHIIQVVGHEVRPLAAEDYEYAQQYAYEEWLTTATEEKTVKINDVWKDLVPQEPQIAEEMLVN